MLFRHAKNLKKPDFEENKKITSFQKSNNTVLDHAPRFFVCYGIIRDYSNLSKCSECSHLGAKIQGWWRQQSEQDSKFENGQQFLTPMD